ncbi:MAG: hypothetical protein SOU84_05010 [Candidatus Faecimonas sp.]|nr:hypothetical protein [Candidatus Faecimonas sp.]
MGFEKIHGTHEKLQKQMFKEFNNVESIIKLTILYKKLKKSLKR